MANVPPQGGRKHPQQEYVQLDTTNILFICGGTFVGLEKIIERRLGKKNIGFHVSKGEPIDKSWGRLLAHVEPTDLIKFGMIPEFIGRLPIVATLNPLTEDDLVRVLVEPKNALVRQYTRFFEMDNVKLTFTEESLRAVARLAIRKETGARALRAILEEIMFEIMFELPGRDDVDECIVTEECVTQRVRPILVTKDGTRKVA